MVRTISTALVATRVAYSSCFSALANLCNLAYRPKYEEGRPRPCARSPYAINPPLSPRQPRSEAKTRYSQLNNAAVNSSLRRKLYAQSTTLETVVYPRETTTLSVTSSKPSADRYSKATSLPPQGTRPKDHQGRAVWDRGFSR